jgi:hypothetical protein
MQIVKNKNLIALIKHVSGLQSDFFLLSRPTVTRCIKKKAEDGCKLLRSKIALDLSFFCATTDIWTSRSLSAFMSFTVHYLTSDFLPVAQNLEVKPFDGKHTGERICTMIHDTMKDWGLASNQLALIVTDNASNQKLAVSKLKVTSVGCVAHQMHLVLASLFFPKKQCEKSATQDESITSLNAISDFHSNLVEHDKHVVSTMGGKIKKFRSLAAYFSRSAKATARLKSFQTSSTKLVCILDVVTRLDCTCEML